MVKEHYLNLINDFTYSGIFNIEQSLNPVLLSGHTFRLTFDNDMLGVSFVSESLEEHTRIYISELGRYYFLMRRDYVNESLFEYSYVCDMKSSLGIDFVEANTYVERGTFEEGLAPVSANFDFDVFAKNKKKVFENDGEVFLIVAPIDNDGTKSVNLPLLKTSSGQYHNFCMVTKDFNSPPKYKFTSVSVTSKWTVTSISVRLSRTNKKSGISYSYNLKLSIPDPMYYTVQNGTTPISHEYALAGSPISFEVLSDTISMKPSNGAIRLSGKDGNTPISFTATFNWLDFKLNTEELKNRKLTINDLGNGNVSTYFNVPVIRDQPIDESKVFSISDIRIDNEGPGDIWSMSAKVTNVDFNNTNGGQFDEAQATGVSYEKLKEDDDWAFEGIIASLYKAGYDVLALVAPPCITVEKDATKYAPFVAITSYKGIDIDIELKRVNTPVLLSVYNNVIKLFRNKVKNDKIKIEVIPILDILETTIILKFSYLGSSPDDFHYIKYNGQLPYNVTALQKWTLQNSQSQALYELGQKEIRQAYKYQEDSLGYNYKKDLLNTAPSAIGGIAQAVSGNGLGGLVDPAIKVANIVSDYKFNSNQLNERRNDALGIAEDKYKLELKRVGNMPTLAEGANVPGLSSIMTGTNGVYTYDTDWYDKDVYQFIEKFGVTANSQTNISALGKKGYLSLRLSGVDLETPVKELLEAQLDFFYEKEIMHPEVITDLTFATDNGEIVRIKVENNILILTPIVQSDVKVTQGVYTIQGDVTENEIGLFGFSNTITNDIISISSTGNITILNQYIIGQSGTFRVPRHNIAMRLEDTPYSTIDEPSVKFKYNYSANSLTITATAVNDMPLSDVKYDGYFGNNKASVIKELSIDIDKKLYNDIDLDVFARVVVNKGIFQIALNDAVRGVYDKEIRDDYIITIAKSGNKYKLRYANKAKTIEIFPYIIVSPSATGYEFVSGEVNIAIDNPPFIVSNVHFGMLGTLNYIEISSDGTRVLISNILLNQKDSIFCSRDTSQMKCITDTRSIKQYIEPTVYFDGSSVCLSISNNTGKDIAIYRWCTIFYNEYLIGTPVILRGHIIEPVTCGISNLINQNKDFANLKTNEDLLFADISVGLIKALAFHTMRISNNTNAIFEIFKPYEVIKVGSTSIRISIISGYDDTGSLFAIREVDIDPSVTNPYIDTTLEHPYAVGTYITSAFGETAINCYEEKTSLLQIKALFPGRCIDSNGEYVNMFFYAGQRDTLGQNSDYSMYQISNNSAGTMSHGNSFVCNIKDGLNSTLTFISDSEPLKTFDNPGIYMDLRSATNKDTNGFLRIAYSPTSKPTYLDHLFESPKVIGAEISFSYTTVASYVLTYMSNLIDMTYATGIWTEAVPISNIYIVDVPGQGRFTISRDHNSDILKISNITYSGANKFIYLENFTLRSRFSNEFSYKVVETFNYNDYKHSIVFSGLETKFTNITIHEDIADYKNYTLWTSTSYGVFTSTWDKTSKGYIIVTKDTGTGDAKVQYRLDTSESNLSGVEYYLSFSRTKYVPMTFKDTHGNNPIGLLRIMPSANDTARMGLATYIDADSRLKLIKIAPGASSTSPAYGCYVIRKVGDLCLYRSSDGQVCKMILPYKTTSTGDIISAIVVNYGGAAYLTTGSNSLTGTGIPSMPATSGFVTAFINPSPGGILTRQIGACLNFTNSGYIRASGAEREKALQVLGLLLPNRLTTGVTKVENDIEYINIFDGRGRFKFLYNPSGIITGSIYMNGDSVVLRGNPNYYHPIVTTGSENVEIPDDICPVVIPSLFIAEQSTFISVNQVMSFNLKDVNGDIVPDVVMFIQFGNRNEMSTTSVTINTKNDFALEYGNEYTFEYFK